MSCCLKNYAKKTVVLTPLTSELAKLEYNINMRSYFPFLSLTPYTIGRLIPFIF